MATTNARIPTATLNSIATAIKGKDGGGNMTAAQMADRIAAISTGGWTKPSDWPDLPALLAADTASSNPHGVSATNRVACLAYYQTETTITVKSPIYIESGTTYTGTGTVYASGTVTLPVGWSWFICYGETYGNSYGYGIMLPANLYQCYWIYGDQTKDNYLVSDWNNPIGSPSAIFNIDNAIISGIYRNLLNASCFRLTCKELKVDATIKDTGTNGNICNNLGHVDKVSGLMAILASDGTVKNNGIFAGVYNSPTEIPDYIYLGLSSTNGGFSSLYNLKKLPKVIAPNLLTSSAITYSFANSPLISADSVATFDDEGNINGGFASFPAIPTGEFISSSGTAVEGATSDATGAASTRTFVLHGLVRDKFTDDQQEAIEDAFYDKGWTLSW